MAYTFFLLSAGHAKVYRQKILVSWEDNLIIVSIMTSLVLALYDGEHPKRNM